MKAIGILASVLGLVVLSVAACGDDDANGSGANGNPDGGTSGGPGSSGGPGTPAPGPVLPGDPGSPTTPPAPSCSGASGSATVTAPVLKTKLKDTGNEGWLGSPALADLDGDGKAEIIVARDGNVLIWHADNPAATVTFKTNKGRVWASPIVGDFAGDAKLEIAVAGRESVFIFDAAGTALSGFPKTWQDEIRTVAAGDVDGNGKLDIVVGSRKGSGATTDIVTAFHGDGSGVDGFPPVASGKAGCVPNGNGDNPCFFAGLYDQNLAIGDLDGDGKQDLVLPHDDAYASFFKGTGEAFDSASIYHKKKTPGIRYMLSLAEAIQGYSDTEDTSNQAHFTNTPPAIADVDKDGKYDIVMLGSVQNASQDDRLRGVALWVMGPDASRRQNWDPPFHVPAYVMGLNDGFAHDFDADPVSGADNLVGATNQASVADINADKAGLEIVFAGFDGKIHAVAADKSELWAVDYATDGKALTGGVAIADLSADGTPEIVFTTYSPQDGGGNLFILASNGQQLHKIALPQRGSMAVPTIGDADGNGTLDIIVSLKDESPTKEAILVYEVPGSKNNCMLWPTGRANNLRNAWIR